MSKKNTLPKMETKAVSWSDGKPLKYQCFLTYQGLRLISDPCRTADMAREDLLRLLKKQQTFVQLALDNFDDISDLPLPPKAENNNAVTGILDFE